MIHICIYNVQIYYVCVYIYLMYIYIYILCIYVYTGMLFTYECIHRDIFVCVHMSPPLSSKAKDEVGARSDPILK